MMQSKKRKYPIEHPASEPATESTDLVEERSQVMHTLYREHKYIETLLVVVASQLDDIERDEELDPYIVYEAIDYLTRYPDRFHHPREDLVYQRAVERSEILLDDVDTLQHEHDALGKAGKNLLKILTDVVADVRPMLAVVSPGREYVQTLRRHMEVEEALVFPKIEQALDANDWEELLQEELLEPVADPLFGPVISREYQKIARSVRRNLRDGAENLLFTEWLGAAGVLEAVDVVSLGWDNSRALASQHFRQNINENSEILRNTGANIGGWLTAPVRCAIANTRNTFGFCGGVVKIGREVSEDLGAVWDNVINRKKNLR
ncbi:MAG: hemerythrin-like domain-containing protein [Halieaceae bacterium]|jgi:hemerythrin-like domain-containing protein